MKKTVFLILITSIFSFFNCIAQDQHKIDSLIQKINEVDNKHDASPIEDTIKINAYYDLGMLIYPHNQDSAISLWKKSADIAQQLLNKISSTDTITKKIYKMQASALNNIGFVYNNKGSVSEAIDFYNQSLKIKEKANDKLGMANSYNNIGVIFKDKGEVEKALEYFNISLKIYEEMKDTMKMANSFNNIGYMYRNQGDIQKALDCYTKCLNIYDKIKNKAGIANSYNNIGDLYKNQEDVIKALEYYNKSLSLFEEIGDKIGVSTLYNNIGDVYNYNKDYDKALEYFNKSLELKIDNKFKKGLASTLNNIACIYDKKGDTQKALEYYNKSLDVSYETGNKKETALLLINLGYTYKEQGNISKYREYANKAYKVSKDLGYPKEIEDAASLMQSLAILDGNYKKAYEFLQEEILMRDSLQNERNYKATQKQQARYEYEKQAALDSIAYERAIEAKNFDLERSEREKEKQQIVIWFFVLGFIIIFVFAVIVFRMFIQKKKANNLLASQNIEINQQKEEIEAQRDEISKHRDLVLYQKEEIEDSINYAKRIQTAMLPTKDLIEDIIKEQFVIYKPKDVVSGDFYWINKINNWLIITTADCTGHGVPGAFMSMLGISFLNEIAQKKEITNAAEVLNKMRKSIIHALKQTGGEGSQKDGIDMSLIAINTEAQNNNNLKTHTAYWAGANSPLWIIRNKTFKVEAIKGDSMPVGVHVIMNDFTNHEIKLEKGDKIYLFTDGYPDQFGGSKGKKLMYRNFKTLIAETSKLSMQEQGKKIENNFENWINYNGQTYEQVDDVTIIGIEI